jgi:asparagine synthase (glutamine-hydrolysing)
MYDEPFANPSAIPTFLVSQLARQHVTVSLSGDGGDEIFGGYNRYTWVERIWRRMGKIPAPLRGILSKGMTRGARPFSLLAGKLGYPNPADKVHKLAEALGAASPADIYLGLVSFWRQPAEVVLNAREPHTLPTDPRRWPQGLSLAEQMMFLDTLTYLPDDGLVKVDRASMAASLEVRVPFVDDYRLLEFAWRLPLDMKIRAGQGKWILRQVLYKYVPKEMIERPKMGFGVPIDSWLRGPLREWAEDLLSEDRLRREGFFHPKPIREKWAEHLSGKRNWQYHLWDILMFQAWLDEWGSMKIILFANTDWYLYNFRLELAKALRARGDDVVFLSPPGDYAQKITRTRLSLARFPLFAARHEPVGRTRYHFAALGALQARKTRPGSSLHHQMRVIRLNCRPPGQDSAHHQRHHRSGLCL